MAALVDSFAIVDQYVRLMHGREHFIDDLTEELATLIIMDDVPAHRASLCR